LKRNWAAQTVRIQISYDKGSENLCQSWRQATGGKPQTLEKENERRSKVVKPFKKTVKP
jgi:hypothetical protein